MRDKARHAGDDGEITLPVDDMQPRPQRQRHGARQLHLALNAGVLKILRGMMAQVGGQIFQRVVARVHHPDNLVHRLEQIARCFGNGSDLPGEWARLRNVHLHQPKQAVEHDFAVVVVAPDDALLIAGHCFTPATIILGLGDPFGGLHDLRLGQPGNCRAFGQRHLAGEGVEHGVLDGILGDQIDDSDGALLVLPPSTSDAAHTQVSVEMATGTYKQVNSVMKCLFFSPPAASRARTRRSRSTPRTACPPHR
ncbi:MAG: hypothetical protein HC793_01800 [Aquincola sp.]|nr:hypothetical protein [Aquincola sp.]